MTSYTNCSVVVEILDFFVVVVVFLFVCFCFCFVFCFFCQRREIGTNLLALHKLAHVT